MKNTKSKRDRVVPMIDPCFNAFVSLYTLFDIPIVPTDNDYIIPGGASGANKAKLQRHWKTIREASGLPSLHIHDCRHLFASRMATKGGADIGSISRLLGHSNLQQTMRYRHLTEAYNREQMAKMSEAVFKKS